uniref:Uncharacterized protein n=1 Tax=Candidatus Kentrum sp. LFY TaxID=2126342 RepID=A0A450UMF0_9GAMM|nr:MAG: hypothetical protein BECKLFY1418B_GA0070995_104912 [Candidatus Kentron sp. LFY]
MNNTDTSTQAPSDGDANARQPMHTRVALRDLLKEIKERDDNLIAHINKRYESEKKLMNVVLVAAAVVGIVMGAVIWSMAKNMTTMAEAMGHMKGDKEEVIARNPMTKNMDTMADSIKVTTENMKIIATLMEDISEVMGKVEDQGKITPKAEKTMAMNIDTMAEKIGEMTDLMGEIRKDMAAVPKMQHDVNILTRTVGMMQYDTGSMRMGVGQMSNDTGNMSHPFRVMNSMMPW